MNIMIDCYAHPANSERYQRSAFEKKPYLIDNANENITYICFDSGVKCAIHRIKKSGTETEITWAFGAWSERSTLEYPLTLNQAAMVNANEIE